MRITVQAGDTPGAIAQRFGTTVEALERLNAIQGPDRVFAGHTLEVPETDTAQTTPRGDLTWLTLPFHSARRDPSRS